MTRSKLLAATLLALLGLSGVAFAENAADAPADYAAAKALAAEQGKPLVLDFMTDW